MKRYASMVVAVTAAVSLVALAEAPQGASGAPSTAEHAPAAKSAPSKQPRTLEEMTPEELANLTDEELEALGLGETVELVAKPLDLGRVAGSAHVVSKETLEAYEYDDVHQVLSQVPGVYVRDEDGFGLRPNIGLRGASSDRSSKVTLMEDGVLLGPAPYSAPAAYYFPLVTRMVEMQVFKGPASIRHGPQTLGGAINMRTRDAAEGGAGQIDLAGGAYWLGKGHVHYGYAAERFGAVLEGVHLRSSGFKELDGGGNTGFDKNEAMLKAFVRSGTGASARHRLDLKLGYANEHSNETYLGLSDGDFQRNPLRRYAASRNDRMDWQRTQAQLLYTFDGGYSFDLQAVAYRHDFARAWQKVNGFRNAPALDEVLRNGDAGQGAALAAILRGDADSTTPAEALMLGTNDRRYVSQGLQAVAHWRPVLGGISHTFEAGARLHYDRIDRLHTELPHRMRGGELELEEGAERLVTAHNRGSAIAGALYLLDEVLLGDFLLVPGARIELIETFWRDRKSGDRANAFDAVLLPGLGIVYQPSAQWTVLAGAHQGFSPVAPGQPDEVQPEQSINLEAGGRYRGEHLQAEAIGFFNHYLNLVGECTFSSGCADALLNRQFNGGAANVYGSELALSANVASVLGARIDARAAYTLTLTEFLSSFNSENPQFGSVERGDELPYVPMHQASAQVQLTHARWSASLSVSFVGAMREQAGQGPLHAAVTTDPHLVLDAAFGYQLTPKTQLYLTGDNLTNTTYVAARRPFGARPGKPLHAELGIKQSF